jgi:hypothetical protein
MKNDVLWDVVLSRSRKKRRFGGTFRLHHQGGRNVELGVTLAVTTK